MKRILLLTIAPLVFLSAISAQITMEEADRIVMERMGGESPPYFVYKYQWNGMLAGESSFTTSFGETIVLDYPCWTYYVSYSDKLYDSTTPGRFLIVKESNGTLMEIKSNGTLPVIDIDLIYKSGWSIWKGIPTGCDCADELYYYPYGKGKTFLDHLFINNRLIIGFDKQAQDEEITDYLNQTGFFKTVVSGDFRRNSISYRCLYVTTTEAKTCSQLKEIIRTLEKSPLVAYAHLAIGTDYQYYTDEFLVILTYGTDLSDLNVVMQETNTKMVGVQDDGYIISADKNSKGDALQMANYFYETGKFLGAKPNFRGIVVAF